MTSMTFTLVTLYCFISNFFTLANTIKETEPLAPPIVWNNITASDFKSQKRRLCHLH